MSRKRECVERSQFILLCGQTMGKHYLSSLFEPQSVAVFGASDRIDSVGQVVFDNLLNSTFQPEFPNKCNEDST